MDVTPLTDAELAELERLEREGTAGEWRGDRKHDSAEVWYVDGPGRWPDEIATVYCDEGANKHAALIAAARNALPRLLAEVRELRAVLRDALTWMGQTRGGVVDEPRASAEERRRIINAGRLVLNKKETDR